MSKGTNIEARINAMSKDIADGMTRADILRKYAKRWRIAPRSIDRYMNKARQKAQEMLLLKQKAEEDAAYEAAKEAEKRRILSREERMEILSKIALGEMAVPDEDFKWNGKKGKFDKIKRNLLPNHEVIKSAINELNRMDGNHAPVELDARITGGLTLVLPPGMDIDLPSNTDG